MSFHVCVCFAFHDNQEMQDAQATLMMEKQTLSRQFEQEQHMSETLRVNLRQLLADHEKVSALQVFCFYWKVVS